MSNTSAGRKGNEPFVTIDAEGFYEREYYTPAYSFVIDSSKFSAINFKNMDLNNYVPNVPFRVAVVVATVCTHTKSIWFLYYLQYA